MAYDTNYPVTCPINDEIIDKDECFVRCMAASMGCPKFNMPGLRPFEEEAAICKACEYYQDD